MKTDKRVFKQLIKEFRIQIGLSIGWAVYSVMNKAPDETTLEVILKQFTTALFLLSWFSGQFIRVKKATKVEDSFELLKSKTEALHEQLGNSINETLNHITGGEGFCRLTIFTNPDLGREYLIESVGEYPLYDVHIAVADVNQPGTESFDDPAFQRKTVFSGTLLPHTQYSFKSFPFELNPETGASFNIFISARNGSFIQLYRLIFHEGRWRHAVRVLKQTEVKYERVDPEYPIKDKEAVFPSHSVREYHAELAGKAANVT